jgi:hypothetical protein
VCGIDPGPLSLRELWWRACGAWDPTVALLVAVSAFAGPVPRNAHELYHPLRAMEIPPPTPAEEAARTACAFDLLGAALKSHTEHTRR